jgi:hypothetical protein
MRHGVQLRPHALLRNFHSQPNAAAKGNERIPPPDKFVFLFGIFPSSFAG